MHNQWWFLIHITYIPNIHDFYRNAACKWCIWINIPASVRSCWYRWFLLFTRSSSVLIFCISGKFWIVYFTTKALHAPAAYIIYYSICICFWGPYACCYMPLIASSNCWLDLRPKIKPATLNHNQSRSCPWVKKVSITSVLFRHFPGLDMIDIYGDVTLHCIDTNIMWNAKGNSIVKICELLGFPFFTFFSLLELRQEHLSQSIAWDGVIPHWGIYNIYSIYSI